MEREEFAFIITSKVTTITNCNLLLECIRHIRILYPDNVIYLINDNSNTKLFPYEELLDYNVELIDSIVKNGGEINPYLFILDPRCKYDRLFYIHDSVIIKKELNEILSSRNDFIPIWYSDKYLWNDIFIPSNMDILNNMIFYGNNNITLHNLLRICKNTNNFLVTFGAMALFNKTFVEYMRDNTNFFSIVEQFKNRNNRCLFERILTCVYITMNKQICTNYICGDINNHPLAFKNTDIYINNYDNYFVKVWQGR
jgi:hypothetical protein